MGTFPFVAPSSGGSGTQQVINALGNISGATSINFTSGTVVTATLTANATFTFTGAPSGVAASFTLYLYENGTGGYTVTWPGSVSWLGGGGAPALNTAPGALNLLTFQTLNGGTSWEGALIQAQPPAGAVGGPSVPALGLGLLTTPPLGCVATQGITGEYVFWCLATAAQTETVTVLGAWVADAGVTTGTGVNEMAIFTEAGVQLGVTGDMTTAMESTGWAEGTLTSGVAVTAGTNYWLAITANFTGSILFISSLQAQGSPPVLNGHYLSLYDSGHATMPASFTPSGVSLNKNALCMYAR